MPEFQRNYEMTYVPNPYVDKNPFIGKHPVVTPKPAYETVRDRLPKPIFDGHEDYLAAYDYAWKTAFGNIYPPAEGSGFVSSFIDTAFNGCLFMWDSSFIMMFTKYASRVFPFQGTMDNFYALQHRDGFICREIVEANGKEHFVRHDPSSTGPNIMPWCEMVYYENMRDRERLAAVYPALRAYHEWFRRNRTWPDGTYFSSGWGCGMDNIQRQPAGNCPEFTHGHMVWNDTCFQQILSAKCLMRMNAILGEPDDVSDLREECDRLTRVVNEKLWDGETRFYYDLWNTGELNRVKHVGAFWALLADCVPSDRLDDFIAHLEDERAFNRPNAVPALSADSPRYHPEGDYWNGGVWAPTTYMVLKGLEAHGRDDLAHTIGEKYLSNVVKVFNDTATLWENYAPEGARRGNLSKPNFVGWTGIAPISVFFEFVLGIRPDMETGRILWDVRHTERHGIRQYPFGTDTDVDLLCEARMSTAEEPVITVTANRPVEVVVRWAGGEKVVTATEKKER